MLDCKLFNGNYSVHDELFSTMEDVIIDQSVVEEKGINNWDAALTLFNTLLDGSI